MKTTTILYNHITLHAPKCEEDLKIFIIHEGDLFPLQPLVIDPLSKHYEVYKLESGKTYALGPHFVTTIGERTFSGFVPSTYNIYKVNKMIPCVPYITRFYQYELILETIEVEAVRSSNQLNYLDFVYGDL